MNNRPGKLARAVVATVAFAATAAHAAVPYRVTDLGPGLASSINNAGQVLGERYDPISGSNTVYVYTPGSGRQFLPDGFMLQVGPCCSDSINDAGVVAGAFKFPGATQGHAALFDPATGLRDLGRLGSGGAPGANASFATGVNNAGQVTGYSDFHAFRYSPTTGMVDLGVGGESPDAASFGLAINDAGQITGFLSDRSNSFQNAFIDTPGKGIVNIHTLGGVSAGGAINNAGQVTGNVTTTDPFFLGTAFLYTPGAGMVRLTAPEVGGSGGAAINAAGEVVGAASFSGSSSRGLFYSAAAGMVDLNTLLDAASTAAWTVQAATDINDRGQIVGYGLRFGEDEPPHGLLLTPVPEPQTWALMLGGLAIVGVTVRRRRGTRRA